MPEEAVTALLVLSQGQTVLCGPLCCELLNGSTRTEGNLRRKGHFEGPDRSASSTLSSPWLSACSLNWVRGRFTPVRGK